MALALELRVARTKGDVLGHAQSFWDAATRVLLRAPFVAIQRSAYPQVPPPLKRNRVYASQLKFLEYCSGPSSNHCTEAQLPTRLAFISVLILIPSG